MKLVSDPAYERAQRYGLFTGSLEEFQTRRLEAACALSRRYGRARCARASTIVVPSAYLAEIAEGWGLRGDRIHVAHEPRAAAS